MKLLIVILAVLVNALPLAAQTNVPVRLALVSENDETANVADILTAQLSGNSNIQLLEREQIAKVYREQGLSAGNANYLKLGQLLGADGLLLLETVKGDTNEFLSLRLVAVKPGVVLMAEQFPLPLNDLSTWAAIFTNHFQPLLPKLAVQVKDAIPISIVNLRSADSSSGAKELEKELKILTIQRLSREPKFFVLERQAMDRLMAEKELGTNETPFWNGIYLLDGVVDQNGYSPNEVTLNVRLTPPGAAQSLSLAVSGSRSNLLETVNQLAAKVTEAIKVQSTVPEWDTADEARQYFDEASWAMRWGVNTEAQAAADSAWALGKHDIECAILRIRAYMVSPDAGKTVVYYPPTEPPDARVIASARHALELYNELSLSLPPGEPKVNSAWYNLGMDNLTTTARILQVYNWSPDFYEPVAGELAELRADARVTDAWMIQSPSVHDSYYVGDREVVYDDLAHFQEQRSIFSLELNCGCLWQETPEDCLALYRRMLASPVFRYLHDCFWFRDSSHCRFGLSPPPPRLVAWNPADQKQIPTVWMDFLQELNASPDLLQRLEAKALRLADSRESTETVTAFTNLFDTFFASRDVLVTNNVDVLYLEWQLDDLVLSIGGSVVYDQQYRPQIDAMDGELHRNILFLRQEQYLKASGPFDTGTFLLIFNDLRHCTKVQAVELKRLMEIYKLRLDGSDRTFFEMTEAELNRIINALDRPASPRPLAPTPRPEPVAPPPAIPPPAAILATVEAVTNAMRVNKFLPVPLEGLPGDSISAAIITAHHWLEGRLLLDFQYSAFIYTLDDQGNWKGTRSVTYPAIAILDPDTGSFRVAACPEQRLGSVTHYYDHTTLWHGDLYTSDGGQIKKFDFQNRQWQKLGAAADSNYELFTVNERLYAANANIIFEITGDGSTTHILASRRRQPPMSVLDSVELGTPALFEGPNHSLRVSTKNKIFTWAGDDWQEVCAGPAAVSSFQIFEQGILFLGDGWNQPNCISRLLTDGRRVDFCMGQEAGSGFNPNNFKAIAHEHPLWHLPLNLSLPHLPAAMRQSDLYLLTDHSQAQDLSGKEGVTQSGYDAGLLCFSDGLTTPAKLLLRFDNPNGLPPVTGNDLAANRTFPAIPPAWLLFTSNYLFFARETSQSHRGPNFGGNSDQDAKPGVWMLPVDQVNAELARQKQLLTDRQNAGRAEKMAGEENVQKTLLAKYDANHNGIIDPDEKEAALDDPIFIQSALDQIDANHNGWPEATEMSWFDANKNGNLDPKEIAGVNIALHLLAKALLSSYDKEGKGWLDRTAYNAMIQAILNLNPDQGMLYQFERVDINFDRRLDVGELESLMRQDLENQLRHNGVRNFFGMSVLSIRVPEAESQQMLEDAVEAYWRHSSRTSGRPPFNPGF